MSPSADTVAAVDRPQPQRARAPRRVIAGAAVGAAALITVGVRLGGALGWWLVACVIGGCALTTVSVTLARRASTRDYGSHVPRMTGRTVVPVTMASSFGRRKWTGGGVVWGSMGPVNASWPLATLELEGGVVTLRLRPRLFGAQPLRLTSGEPGLVFPARGWFGTRGIGLRAAAGRPGYFWTTDRAALLSTLAAAGFAVTWDEQQIQYF